MLLSDRDIHAAIVDGSLSIDPYDGKNVQPSSIDLRLGTGLRVMQGGDEPVDPENLRDHTVPLAFTDSFRLRPGDFVLAQTMERVTLPDDVAGKLEGKSSLGRLGLVLHATAGFIDPGFSGTITLELSLSSCRSLVLRPGMLIGQICFFRLSSPAVNPYGSPALESKYQGQDAPTPSRYIP